MKQITAKGIGSLSRAPDGSPVITLNSQVEEGPAGTSGRRVSVELEARSIAFLFGQMASMPAFRSLFRLAADALDECEAKAATARYWDDLKTATEVQRVVAEALRKDDA